MDRILTCNHIKRNKRLVTIFTAQLGNANLFSFKLDAV
jgi:hypothetical protein